MRKTKKSEGKCCLFIDFKSAYNTVKKDIVFHLLREKNILFDEEIEFLRALYKNIYFIEK